MSEDWHQERRAQSPQAARERRMQQRSDWEHQHGSNQPNSPALERDHLSETFASALGALVDAAWRLPAGEQSAGLHQALKRIGEAADHDAAHAAALALVSEAEQALGDDPWVRFHKAALHLVAVIDRT
jgi:hypothetical protein